MGAIRIICAKNAHKIFHTRKYPNYEIQARTAIRDTLACMRYLCAVSWNVILELKIQIIGISRIDSTECSHLERMRSVIVRAYQ